MITPMRQRKPGSGGAVVRELHPGRSAPATDAEIVADLRAGERTAAATLFDRYGNLVERLLWSLLGPESEAEDLLQATRFVWRGKMQHVRLDPHQLPYAVWRVRPVG